MKLTKTQRAIKAAIARAGGPEEVRKARGLKSVQAVYLWIKNEEVPAKHLVHLAELAGMTTDMVLGVGEMDER